MALLNGSSTRSMVFPHIMKTAGTSLKRVIEKNYPAASHEQLDYGGFRQETIRKWWASWAASLDKKQVVVAFDDSQTNEKALKDAIKSAGFEASPAKN